MAMLTCPKCRRHVELKPEREGFVCETCRLLYPIEDDIPNFLIDEARPLDGPSAG